jgi:Ca2+-transporting ATPase
MPVAAVGAPDGDLDELAWAVTACNDAEVPVDPDDLHLAHGDPTEVALVVYGREGGAAVAAAPPHRVAEIPFDSERRRMVTVHERMGVVPGPAGFVAYAKGAPEAVLPRCALTPEGRDEAGARARSMAEAGLRVLAVARAELDVVPADLAEVEQGWCCSAWSG